MTDCEPKYKNLNRIQSFSEQRYVTVQLMQQACMNDEYLKQYCDRLNYLSPPAVRKQFKPLVIDPKNSWGYEQSSTDGTVSFSNKTEETILVDFTDMDLINLEESDVDFKTYIDEEVEPSDSTAYTSVEPAAATDDAETKMKCQLKSSSFLTGEETLNTETKNTGTVDGYWYVGFDKSKNYYVRPDWLVNYRDGEIPSVCRAQTFKVKKSGRLKSVNLKLDYTGSYHNNCGSPLYVQIWDTYKRKIRKTQWDSTKKKEVPVKDNQGNPVYEYVRWLKNPASKNKQHDADKRYHPLAEGKYYPRDMQKGETPEIEFDTYPQLTKGHTYAIVLFSPLSEYKHCPLIGGWTKKNKTTNKYSDGNAFFSKNNSRTWERYGYNDDTVKGSQSKYAPRDFYFQCNMILGKKTEVEGYDTDTHYLYLNPIYRNNITSININATDAGETVSDNTAGLKYQFSTDGKTWTDISNTTVNLSKPSNVILIRAKMWSIDGTTTPFIENLVIKLGMNVATEMYVRTPFVNASTNQMLGGHIWSRIYAPFTTEKDTECTVEIIKSTPASESFTIITIDDIDTYLEEFDIDSSSISALTDEARVLYFDEHNELLEELKKHNIYVKPEIVNETYHKLSFKPTLASNIVESDDMLAGLQFKNNVSYHIIECSHQSSFTGIVTQYSEWIHYTFDYTTNELLLKKSTIDDMPLGSLTVSYYPTFLDQLTIDEVGDKTTGEQGLILDYFQETIPVTSTMLVNRKIPLRVKPVDPIRSVILNKDTDDEQELIEGKDYYLEIDSNILIFNVNNTDMVSSILKLNDVVTVVYTPNLDDESIAIGYHAKRTDTQKQVRIEENYIEYKV